MKSYNSSTKVLLQHLTYRGILEKGAAVTPNVSKGDLGDVRPGLSKS